MIHILNGVPGPLDANARGLRAGRGVLASPYSAPDAPAGSVPHRAAGGSRVSATSNQTVGCLRSVKSATGGEDLTRQ